MAAFATVVFILLAGLAALLRAASDGVPRSTTSTAEATDESRSGTLPVSRAWSSSLILLTVAGFAGAASFTHVHDWTMANSPDRHRRLVRLGQRRHLRTRPHRRPARPSGDAAAPAHRSATRWSCSSPPPACPWPRNSPSPNPARPAGCSSAVPALAFMALAKLVLAPVTTTHRTPPPKPSPTRSGRHSASDRRRHTGRPTPAADAEPATVRSAAGASVPTARFAIVNHEQHHGRPITVDELAARMAVTPAVAGQLLADQSHTTPTPVRPDQRHTRARTVCPVTIHVVDIHQLHAHAARPTPTATPT